MSILRITDFPLDCANDENQDLGRESLNGWALYEVMAIEAPALSPTVSMKSGIKGVRNT